MRKSPLFTLACCTIFLACSGGIEFVPKSITLGIFNFKKYSEKGFLFTPHGYLGDYESIGIMSITLSPSAKIIEINTGKKGLEDKPIYNRYWDIDKINAEEALDSLFIYATNLGANAIVDLEIREISQSYNMNNTNPSIHPPITIYSLKINGYAIKRLGAFK